MPTKNNNPRGIVLILLAMMIFSIQDSIMKYIYNFVSLYEVYLVRTLVSLIIILLFLKLTKRPIVFKTQYPLLTSCRVILFFFGFSSFYISLTVMPLATATALFFVTPFLITIFASIFLKEDLEEKIIKYKEQIEKLEKNISVLDSILKQSSFTKASDLLGSLFFVDIRPYITESFFFIFLLIM